MLFTTNLVGRTEMRSAGFSFYMCLFTSWRTEGTTA